MSMRIVKNYIFGQYREPEATGWFEVENPSSGEVIARTPLSTVAESCLAVEAAARAFPQWRQVPAARRVQYLFKLSALLSDNEERLARGISEEMGKSLPDARAEVKRAIENCQVACGLPVLQQGDKLVGASQDIDGEVLRLPLGVFALAGPFNFPCMVPFWFFPYAIAAGNTFVVKPSERVPLSMQTVTDLIHQTGLPPGVFNLVNGDRTVVEALIDHPRVKGFSLVGSTPHLPGGRREMRQEQQTLPGDGVRQEPPGGDARCPRRRGRPKHDHLLLRLRRSTVHGLLGPRGRGPADLPHHL